MKLYYMLFLVIILISCKSRDDDIYKFGPSSIIDNKISLVEFTDDIDYIPLDNEFPIGMIYQYELKNNSIYLSAKDVGVLEFNRKGEFIRKIGGIGRGPGEYIFFMHFAVNEKNGSVYIMDYNAIKVYSGNGDYIRSISLEETGGFFQQIDYYDSKLFLPEFILMGKAKYNWIILDTLGNIIEQKENFLPQFSSTLLSSGGTFKFKDRISYWNYYDDTVYTIFSDLKYKTFFLFEKGDHRNPRALVPDYAGLTTLNINTIFETNYYIIIRYYFNKKYTIALIDKKGWVSYVSYFEKETNNGANIYTGGIENNFDGGMRFVPEYYFSENNKEYMVELRVPYQYKAHVASEEFKNSTPKYPEKKKELKRLADSLDETDNPVLMIVRLKK